MLVVAVAVDVKVVVIVVVVIGENAIVNDTSGGNDCIGSTSKQPLGTPSNEFSPRYFAWSSGFSKTNCDEQLESSYNDSQSFT